MTHAAAHLGVDLDLTWLETTDMADGAALEGTDGIIVPGGFGSRGTEGKIAAIGHARVNGIPFLGLCFGFQLAVAEYARTVCGLERANSTENDAETPHPVIDLLPDQRDLQEMGGTMRLGTYPATLAPGTLVRALYGGAEVVDERHRHRYEVNHVYVEQLEKAGLVFSGRSPDDRLMEFLELPDHPFFVATQAHPEFKSRLERPAPLFLGFLKAAAERARTRLKGKKATD
jgi:CTP synthase